MKNWKFKNNEEAKKTIEEIIKQYDQLIKFLKDIYNMVNKRWTE